MYLHPEGGGTAGSNAPGAFLVADGRVFPRKKKQLYADVILLGNIAY